MTLLDCKVQADQKSPNPSVKSSSTFIESGPTNEATPLIKRWDSDATITPHSDLIYEAEFSDYLSEIGFQFKTCVPIVLAFLLQAIMPLGKEQLGAAALSNMFATITGWSVAIGMATALDTLCSQSFTGSKDKSQVGLHAQRGLLVALVVYMPISVVWYNSEYLLRFLHIDSEVAKHSGVYLSTLILGAPAYMGFECLKKFLQAQRIMKAQTYVVLFSLPFNLILNYLLVWYPPTSIGFRGAPLTIAITQWITLGFGLIYTFKVEGHECWGGWSREALKGWWPYLKLGLPGILMICAEWWAFEIMSLSASYLGKDQLAAQSIVMSMTNATYSMPMGMSIAASNRMGNLLGAGMPNRARLASRCSVILSMLLPLVNLSYFMFLGPKFGGFFSTDPIVLKYVALICPVAAIYQVFDCVATTCGGLLRGQGRQKVGAIVNFIAYYVLAIPIALYLTFGLDFNVVGLWYGTCIALTISATAVTFYVLVFTDWNKEVSLCFKRITITATTTSQPTSQSH